MENKEKSIREKQIEDINNIPERFIGKIQKQLISGWKITVNDAGKEMATLPQDILTAHLEQCEGLENRVNELEGIIANVRSLIDKHRSLSKEIDALIPEKDNLVRLKQYEQASAILDKELAIKQQMPKIEDFEEAISKENKAANLKCEAEERIKKLELEKEMLLQQLGTNAARRILKTTPECIKRFVRAEAFNMIFAGAIEHALSGKLNSEQKLREALSKWMESSHENKA